MIKTFPKKRLCTLDIYPAIKKGLSISIQFMNNNSIDFSSSDGKRIIIGNCLNEIQNLYKNSPNTFQKVCFIDDNLIDTKVRYFIENYLDKLMKRAPLPYCGIMNSNSPDLEFAAESSLYKNKKQRAFESIKSSLKLK
jgi:hypothetical protein